MAGKGNTGGRGNEFKLKIREFQERLDDLNCDPLEAAVNFLNGNMANDPHPFLKEIYRFSKESVRRLNKGLLTELEFNEFMHKCDAELRTGYVKPELYVKIALELLNYLYPKRKAVEHIISPGDTPLDELSDEALQLIMRKAAERKMHIEDAKSKTKPKSKSGKLH